MIAAYPVCEIYVSYTRVATVVYIICVIVHLNFLWSQDILAIYRLVPYVTYYLQWKLTVSCLYLYSWKNTCGYQLLQAFIVFRCKNLQSVKNMNVFHCKYLLNSAVRRYVSQENSKTLEEGLDITKDFKRTYNYVLM